MLKLLPLLLAAIVVMHPTRGPREIWRCSRFVVAAVKHRRSIGSWLEASKVGGLASSLASRPAMIGIVQWPYVHKDWTVGERFSAIKAHYEEVEALPALCIGVTESRIVADLGQLVSGLCLVLDRSEWFQREGELTLNLFLEDTRLYSLSFLFGREDGQRTAMVGAIQGRNMDGVRDRYKHLTKKLHGARPRDFLLTLFQMMAACADVRRIIAVNDECRHHRHPYFGGMGENLTSVNYDEVWADRGGVPIPGGWFELPVRPAFKPLTEVPVHKRSMYRRRYAMYEDVRGSLQAFFSGSLTAHGPHLRPHPAAAERVRLGQRGA